MHLERRVLRLHQPTLLCLSIPLLYIPQRLPHKCLIQSISRNIHIQFKGQCHLYPGSKQHLNCRPILLQRLIMSHRACGVIPSPAHMIPQEINDDGICKRTGPSTWIVLFRKREQDRLAQNTNSMPAREAHGPAHKWEHEALFWWVGVLFEQNFTGTMIRISDGSRSLLLLHIQLSFPDASVRHTY